MIPFIDMKARHAPHRQEFLDAIGEIIDSGEFAHGSAVPAFEKDFATYCGTLHAVAVGNGTEALWLTLLAMGIGRGDEVITVPMTFMATVEAIIMTGAVPVFVDIDEQTYTMNPSALGKALSPRTKAIIPVHLFGQTAEMEPIIAFAAIHGLMVIEDASQAHGANGRTRRAGTYGDAGCFSFYPAKNLGAFGDAGAIVTNSADLAHKLRDLRDHGQQQKNHHATIGWNSRMDSIQAAVLRIKLRAVDAQNHTRRQHAQAYDRALAGLPDIITPKCAQGIQHVYHLYVIRSSCRKRIQRALQKDNIGYAIHYPIPAHLQPACAALGWKPGSFSVSERCAHEFLSLPMYPELTSCQIERVVGSIQQALDSPVTSS